MSNSQERRAQLSQLLRAEQLSITENHRIILQPLGKLQRYFEYLSPKNELKDLHGVFAEETADGKITAK